jgi:hypothetical protein
MWGRVSDPSSGPEVSGRSLLLPDLSPCGRVLMLCGKDRVMPNSPEVHPNAPAGGAGAGFSKGAKPLGLNTDADVADFTRGPVGTNPFKSALAANAQPALTPDLAGTAAAGGGTAKGEAKAETDPVIEGLNLSDTAKKAAYELKKLKPSVVFTSGLRTKDEQARAMAGNVVQQRNWIEKTYAKSKARDACQKWVDDNKEKTTKDEIAAGLKEVLDGLTDAQLNALSFHLSGRAFDVQPVDPDKDEIKKAMQGLTGKRQFLDKEGNLVRWHVEFN